MRQQSSHTHVSRARQQTLPYERTRSLVASATASTIASNVHVQQGLPPPLVYPLSFPDNLIEMRKTREAVPLKNRRCRWSHSSSISSSVAKGSTSDLVTIPWKVGHDHIMQQSYRSRRTSPRRRLATSKARVQAFGLQDHADAFDHFEDKRIRYGLADRNHVKSSTLFVPPVPAVSRKLLPPMPWSPTCFVDDADTRRTTKGSRYMRHMDRVTTFGRVDSIGKLSARADDIHVTRAASRLHKYREHDNDLVAKDTKRA